MATKVFILANKNSSAYLKELTEKCWKNYSGNDGRKSAKDTFQLTIFENSDTYSKVELKKAIKVGVNKHETVDKIFVLITPELQWKSDFVDEGYEYALEIINNKLIYLSSTIQFRFLSTLSFELLLKNSRPHLRRLIEAFPHYDVDRDEDRISEELFAEYSPTHYNLIKKLAISDAGYINYVLHEINSVIGSSKPSEEKDRYILNSISGLGYIDTGNNLTAVVESYSLSTRLDVFEKCRELLNDLYIRLDNSDITKQLTKIPYTVLVVEDDPKYRESLNNLLVTYFSSVEIFVPAKGKTFTTALRNRLPKDADNYDIIFLDLLYKNENGNWSSESGLDLYKTIKNRNSFCVTPIVTSLPRAAVSSLVKEVDEAGIPYHLLLSKANGEDFLKLDFKEKLPDIIRTCRENEKKKKMFKPFPSDGIFEGLSVPSIMLKLTTEKRTTFDEIVNKATKFFNDYKNGSLSIDTMDWNQGKLPSQKKVNNTTEAYLIAILPNILAHRLIVIDNALKSGNNKINIIDYERDVLIKIGNIAKLNKGYLTTKLGFSATKKEKSFVIDFKNIFLHEQKYFENNTKEKNSESLNNYKEVKDWFLSILIDLNTYKIWDELNLSYTPYINPSSIDRDGCILSANIQENLTITNLIDFLKALKTHFSIESVSRTLDVAIDNYKINEYNAKIPKDLKPYIYQIFEL